MDLIIVSFLTDVKYAQKLSLVYIILQTISLSIMIFNHLSGMKKADNENVETPMTNRPDFTNCKLNAQKHSTIQIRISNRAFHERCAKCLTAIQLISRIHISVHNEIQPKTVATEISFY